MNPWVAFENQTIYIRADGSVDPTGAPILRRGDLYAIVYSMVSGSDGIIIERHSIIIDGNGSAILGLPGARSVGIRLSDNNDVTIKNLEITGFDYGVQLGDCYNCTLERCNIAESHEYGVLVIDPLSVFANNTLHDCNITGAIHLAGVVLASSCNLISQNNIMDDGRGIWLFDSSGNTIAENNITRNLSPGIWFSNSSNNVIFHNNFDFGFEDAIDTTSTNTFDDGYPNGGNYWGSGYSGPDNCCGPYQNLTGSDCIGDTQYSMNENNTDRYPFMEANGWLNHPVSIESNVTITHQVIGSGAMNFTASGPVGQIGYVNATMPIGFNSTDIRVFIDGLLVQQPLPIITTDGFHYFIYFEFSLSTHDITIQYAVPAATQTGGGGGRMPYMN